MIDRTQLAEGLEQERRLYAERNPANLQVVKVTEADLTYVAIDLQGQPRPVPR
jgi:acyl-CoA hydrolase